MLRSDFCDYSDTYLVGKGTITVTDPDNNTYDEKKTFKNNAVFTSCISKINNTLIDNAEYLDFVMLMYNLIENSKNSSQITESLWNYYRDEQNCETEGNINYSIEDSKSFDYKTRITGRLEGKNAEEEVKLLLSKMLKNLSNFWRALDIPLIKCEITLMLTWSENCVITSKARKDADPDVDPAKAAFNNPANAIFEINDAKL